MAYIKSKGIYALEEPNPRRVVQRKVPHYLYIPDTSFGSKECLSRTVRDVGGYIDPRTREAKNQEINYLFLRGQPTPVWKEEHVHWLLKDLAGAGIVEVAWTPGPDKIEHFHPERTNPLDIKVSGSRYRLDESVEHITKTFKPVKEVVIRTPADIEKGLKMTLKEDDRKVSAEQLVAGTKTDKKAGKK